MGQEVVLQPLLITFDDWSGGVVNSTRPDLLPLNASPRGWNSSFRGVGPGKVAIEKRMGCQTQNRTAITGSPAVLGQYEYKRLSAGAFTPYHLLVSSEGRLDKLQSDLTTTAADSGTVAPFTSGTLWPSFATANNLCFIVNGTNAKKFNGTDVLSFGITRPAAPTLGVGSGTDMTGTYDVAISYYNSATGHESSRSDATTITSLVAQAIDVDWVASADEQVTHVKVYIRKTTLTPEFYQAASVAIGTITYNIDLTDTELSALTIKSPDTSENDPPPSGIKVLAWHHSRLFAADNTKVYYSKVALPEAFDPDSFIQVNPDDGQKIVGLLSAFERLLVFKSDSIYALFGTDPNSWEIRILVRDVGATSHMAICSAEGVIYWWSEHGAFGMAELGQAKPLAQPYLLDTVNTALNFSQYSISCAAPDVVNQRIMFAVPEAGQTRNTRILPWNYRIGRWESDKWDPFDVASMAVIEDTNGKPWVFLGNYGGQIFKWWAVINDGIAAGTISGTVTAIDANTLVITDSAATFDTTGAGLAERTIYLTNAADTSTLRRRIVSNNATTITVAVAATGVDTTYTYTIGGSDFQWDTPWIIFDTPFHNKKFEQVFAVVESDTTLRVEKMLGYNLSTSTISGSTAAAIWGTMVWGAFVWGEAGGYNYAHLRIGTTSQAIRLRLRNRVPSSAVAVYRLGVSAELLSERR